MAWGAYAVGVRKRLAPYPVRLAFGTVSLYTAGALVVPEPSTRRLPGTMSALVETVAAEVTRRTPDATIVVKSTIPVGFVQRLRGETVGFVRELPRHLVADLGEPSHRLRVDPSHVRSTSDRSRPHPPEHLVLPCA